MIEKSKFIAKQYEAELKQQYPFITDNQASTMTMFAKNGWEFNGRYSKLDSYFVMVNPLNDKKNSVRLIFRNGTY